MYISIYVYILTLKRNVTLLNCKESKINILLCSYALKISIRVGQQLLAYILYIKE